MPLYISVIDPRPTHRDSIGPFLEVEKMYSIMRKRRELVITCIIFFFFFWTLFELQFTAIQE